MMPLDCHSSLIIKLTVVAVFLKSESIYKGTEKHVWTELFLRLLHNVKVPSVI